jgi:putative restriction endonuclease
MVLWTRDETILAVELYLDIGGVVDSSTPDVVRLAAKLGRTPGSVSFKIGNLRHVATGGRRGWSHSSRTDREVWSQLGNAPARLAVEADLAWNRISLSSPATVLPHAPSAQMADRLRRGDFRVPDGAGARKIRYLQYELREFMLALYGNQCALCGISESTLLVTSHISGWADDLENRLNPANAIILCSLHDRAFEMHLLEFRADLSVELAPAILRSRPFESRVLRGDGSLRAPSRFAPDRALLQRHRLHRTEGKRRPGGHESGRRKRTMRFGLANSVTGSTCQP